jgi:predicted DNA-binding protein
VAKIQRITIRIDDDMLSRLEAHAERERRTVADIVRLVLEDHLPEVPPQQQKQRERQAA